MVTDRTLERCEVCGGDLIKTESGCRMATVDAYRCVKCGDVRRREQGVAKEAHPLDELDEIERRIATADLSFLGQPLI